MERVTANSNVFDIRIYHFRALELYEEVPRISNSRLLKAKSAAHGGVTVAVGKTLAVLAGHHSMERQFSHYVVGVSVCSLSDMFDRKRGRTIATGRMMLAARRLGTEKTVRYNAMAMRAESLPDGNNVLDVLFSTRPFSPFNNGDVGDTATAVSVSVPISALIDTASLFAGSVKLEERFFENRRIVRVVLPGKRVFMIDTQAVGAKA